MSDELKKRLDAARAKLAEIEAVRAAREEEVAPLAQVEALERAATNAAAIAKAEVDHGPVGKKIRIVDTDLGVIIVKRPNHVLFRKFQDEGKFDTITLDKLVRPCVVYPDHARLDSILDELPATLLRLADAVSVLAGVRKEELSGKS